MKQVKVMIVDDSAVVRQVLSGLLEQDPQIQVIGTASDPLFALSKMEREWPDVIVLDVEMPRMDGITFLRKLMAERPTPVVICSTLTAEGAATTLQALSAGAVSIVCKPQVELRRFLTDAGDELRHEVKAAARANLRHIAPPPAQAVAALQAVRSPAEPVAMSRTTDRVVAIGTSTGGTQALEHILRALPEVSPGMVIVQHMPEKFTAAFAERLDRVCRITVKEAANGDRVRSGIALIAPGGRHMRLVRNGAQYHVEVFDGPLVSRHRPSVDVLFRSVAKTAGRNAVGIIMTGMGDDGARGLLEMRQAGARTFGQDEATCVVYGMPREAFKLGAVEAEVPLAGLSRVILDNGFDSGRRAG